MEISILILAMLSIFIMILFGYGLYKKGIMDKDKAKAISFIVCNICNPCLLMNNALAEEEKMDPHVFFTAFLVEVCVYLVLTIASYVICAVIRIPENISYAYKMLTVYGNVGFIGIPICNAVFGPGSLFYVTINCLIFNFWIYSIGMIILKRAKQRLDKEQQPALAQSSVEMAASMAAPSAAQQIKETVLGIFNVGTIGAMITVVIYLTNPEIPSFLETVISYAGNSCIFLSMIVLGCSVAAAPLKELIFGGKRMWAFLFVRMLVLPIFLIMLLKPWVKDPLLMGSTAIMLALPGGNLPLMIAKGLDLDETDLSRGIVLSTILCLFTIPIVCLAL